MTKPIVKKSDKDATGARVVISPPNIQAYIFAIEGTAPYVQHNFSQKAKAQMLEAQTSSAATKKGGKKSPRDIEEDYEGAFHYDSEGGYGIPASAFRSAMISACRVAGFQMTKAKLSVWVMPDSYDREDGTGLVRLYGDPEMHKAAVRLETGVASISIRPMWKEWTCNITVQFDGDQFTKDDICNLLLRAGMQVGVGEGRPDSKKSHGMGWGTFKVV